MYILIVDTQYEIPNSVTCIFFSIFNTAHIPQEGLQTCQVCSWKTKLILNHLVKKEKLFHFQLNFFQEIYFISR